MLRDSRGFRIFMWHSALPIKRIPRDQPDGCFFTILRRSQIPLPFIFSLKHRQARRGLGGLHRNLIGQTGNQRGHKTEGDIGGPIAITRILKSAQPPVHKRVGSIWWDRPNRNGWVLNVPFERKMDLLYDYILSQGLTDVSE